ncbi:MAG: DUF6371 domain-containing protein [Flavobacteriales bacterium]
MQSRFPYNLEKGSKKHECPRCHKKRYVRYKDTESGNYLDSRFGRCDREVNCGYHLSPFQERIGSRTIQPTFSAQPQPATSFMDASFVTKSLDHQNNLTEFLHATFGFDLANEVIEQYQIGTAKNWNGATVFWQIDLRGRIRTGKVMLYDQFGHRVKVPFNHVTWAHSALRLKDYNLRQCFFGERLLSAKSQLPVAVVESEKTAIIASIHYPQFVWIATGGKNGCRWKDHAVNEVLSGRHVVLFPDLGAYSDWKESAETLQCKSVRVSDILEKHASDEERKSGLDLADYLLKFANSKRPNLAGSTTVGFGLTADEVLSALGDVTVR